MGVGHRILQRHAIGLAVALVVWLGAPSRSTADEPRPEQPDTGISCSVTGAAFIPVHGADSLSTGGAGQATLTVPLFGSPVAADLAFLGASNHSEADVELRTFVLNIGPRLQGPLLWNAVRPYGLFHLGWVRFDAPSLDENDLGFEVGGGIELRLTRILLLDLGAGFHRIIRRDYPDVGFVRAGAGLVVRP